MNELVTSPSGSRATEDRGPFPPARSGELQPTPGRRPRSRGQRAEQTKPPSSALDAVLAMDRVWRDEVARQADAALGMLRILRRWTWVVTGAFFAIGTGLLLYLPYYVIRNAGSMGTQIMGPRGGSPGPS